MNLFAYIDPGTGSMIVQALIGVFAGIAIFFRSFISQALTKVKLVFTKSEPSKTKE